MLEIGSSEYLDSPRFSPRERAAVLWAEHMAKNTARERDDIFEEVKQYFTDSEFVELTGVCGYFASNNRFQDSMRLPIEAQSEVEKIKVSVGADPARIEAYIGQMLKNWPGEFPVPPGAASQPITTVSTSNHGLPQSAMRPPRVPLLDPHSAQGETARFFRNAEQLLGAAPNAVRIWAHSPYIVKLILPLVVTLQREGAGSILPIALKAIVRIRTSHAHRAPYSLAHATAMARAAGVTEEQLEALPAANCANSPHFTARERAALVWAEQMAPNAAKRHEDGFSELKKHLSNAEIVELTGLCALSSQLDLIQNALRVPLERASEIERMNRTLRLEPQQLRAYLENLLAQWPREFPARSPD